MSALELIWSKICWRATKEDCLDLRGRGTEGSSGSHKRPFVTWWPPISSERRLRRGNAFAAITANRKKKGKEIRENKKRSKECPWKDNLKKESRGCSRESLCIYCCTFMTWIYIDISSLFYFTSSFFVWLFFLFLNRVSLCFNLRI